MPPLEHAPGDTHVERQFVISDAFRFSIPDVSISLWNTSALVIAACIAGVIEAFRNRATSFLERNSRRPQTPADFSF